MISIIDSSILRYRTAQRSDDIVHKCMSQACVRIRTDRMHIIGRECDFC